MTISSESLDMVLNAVSLAHGGNALLAGMSKDDLKLLAPWCSRQRFSRGVVLSDAGEPADALYFIEYGVASVIKPRSGAEKTEIVLIGPESFVGAPVIVGDGCWPYRTFVQVDQLQTIRIPIDKARSALEHSRSLERLLMNAVYSQMVQIAEGLVSAAWQRLDARLARWLLMYRDRQRSDRLEVTHEFMAMMVGVQRTGVTEALHDLEGAGLIAAARGLVTIRDPAALQRLAGDGYGIAEREHARLFPS